MAKSHSLVTILDTVVDIIGGRAYTISRRIFTSTMKNIFNEAPRKLVAGTAWVCESSRRQSCDFIFVREVGAREKYPKKI